MTIKELFDNLYDEKTPKSSQSFIKAYETNIELIENVDLSIITDYDYAMCMTKDYAIELHNLGYYKKSLQFLNKSIHMMENFPGFDKNKLFDLSSYENIVFYKARSLYHLKYYKKSLVIFKELYTAFPDNDLYYNWINSIKITKYDYCISIGLGIFFIILFSRLFLREQHQLFYEISFWLMQIPLLFTIILIIIRFILTNRKR